MIDDVMISVNQVSMLFNLSSEKIDNIKEYFIRAIKGHLYFEEFWALKDISFEIKRGEKVAIVGLNGSGKSTLLKVIAGVLYPTRGSITVKGTIAPLIELGAGFDMDLSARENIFLNGAVLGYSRDTMAQKIDEILDFAELTEFQNVAIKNYSSGMIARLGFSIATCFIPDILIIDEILAVGDFEFQRKCLAKMQQMADDGTTMLFVSHSADQVKTLCEKAIWLDHGNMVKMGNAAEIVDEYMNGIG